MRKPKSKPKANQQTLKPLDDLAHDTSTIPSYPIPIPHKPLDPTGLDAQKPHLLRGPPITVHYCTLLVSVTCSSPPLFIPPRLYT